MNTYNKPNVATIVVVLGLLAVMFVPAISFGQVEPPAECGFIGTGTEATQLGGMWMTARDTLHAKE